MTRAGRKTKRRKSGAPKARPTVELIKEFYTARLAASAAAWGELMGQSYLPRVASAADDQTPYPLGSEAADAKAQTFGQAQPPEPVDHTWTDEDKRARMEHRKALAAPPTKLMRKQPHVT